MDRAGAFTTVPGDLKWEPDEPDGSISAQLSSPRMVTEAMTMTYDQTEATLSQIRTQLDHAVSGDAVAAITELADTLPAALPDDPETVGHVADGQTALAGAMAALRRAVDAAQAALRSHELNNGPAHEAAQSAGGAPEREYVTDGLAGQIELAFNPDQPRNQHGEWTGGPLFHGSRYPLKPGDLISGEEAAKFANFGETDDEYVHATTSPVKASGFAEKADQFQAQRRAEANGLPPLPRNRIYPGKVYLVEPTGPVESDADWAGEEGSVRSKHPFRVIQEHDPWSSAANKAVQERYRQTETSNPASHLLTTDLAAWEHEPRGKGGEWVGLDAHDYPGTVGSSKHITRTESGMIPLSAIANLHGAEGEKPGEHRTRQGQDWEDFKAGIAANGIKNPVFVTVDHGQEPKISEGNHRRDAAAELGMTHVPAEVRYFGHAEQQGTVTDRARHTA